MNVDSQLWTAAGGGVRGVGPTAQVCRVWGEGVQAAAGGSVDVVRWRDGGSKLQQRVGNTSAHWIQESCMQKALPHIFNSA